MRCDTRPDARVRPCDRRRPRYLLSGLIVCGACGGRYTKISAELFGCAAARNKGAAVCDNLRNVRRDRVEGMVLDALRHELMDPDLFREFCAEFTRELNRLQSGESTRRDRLVTELAQIERRLRRMVDAIAEGVPARTLKDELLALERRQEELRAELDAAREPTTTRLHPNLAELYRQKVAALHAALEDETTARRGVRADPLADREGRGDAVRSATSGSIARRAGRDPRALPEPAGAAAGPTSWHRK